MWTILPYLHSHVSNISTVSVKNFTADRTSYSRPIYNSLYIYFKQSTRLPLCVALQYPYSPLSDSL